MNTLPQTARGDSPTLAQPSSRPLWWRPGRGAFAGPALAVLTLLALCGARPASAVEPCASGGPWSCIAEQLTAEEEARIAGDQALQDALDALEARHDAEVADLQAQLDALAAALAQETADRIADVDAEQARATAAEAQLAADLAAEEAARIADVDAEETRATAAEAQLTADLAAEEAARIADVDAEEAARMAAIATEHQHHEDGDQAVLDTLQGVDDRLASVETWGDYFSLTTIDDGSGNSLDTVQLTAANLRLVNGTGVTMSWNGLGNLLIGYNAERPAEQVEIHGEDPRTGSHCIVMGDENGYAASAGFVGGLRNNIAHQAGHLGPVVLTGSGNKATQGFAAIVTGTGNKANGGTGAILGGGGNSIAYQGPMGAIVGGQANAVLGGGLGSSILGGWGNSTSGDSSCIAGGHSNQATAHVATVGGGRFNVASAHSATVSGGESNTASGERSTVSGGTNRTASLEGEDAETRDRIADVDAEEAARIAAIATEHQHHEDGDQAILDSMGDTDGRLAALEEWGDYFSLTTIDDGSGNALDTVQLTAANLRLVNGTGDTMTTNGLGNLLLGYNAARPDGAVELVGPNVRTGSHGIVMGDQNSYSSPAGFVGGWRNTIEGERMQVVLTGTANRATRDYAFIASGDRNRALAAYSAIVSGQLNETQGGAPLAAVLGGFQNVALSGGLQSSILGGAGNRTSADAATVSGGRFNEASGYLSSIAGGQSNSVSGSWSTVGGGVGRSASLEGEDAETRDRIADVDAEEAARIADIATEHQHHEDGDQAILDSMGDTDGRLAALEEWGDYFSLTTVDDGSGNALDTVQLTAANLRLVNGTGATVSRNGLGNLLIGYNADRSPGAVDLHGEDPRTGSHCIVLGDENGYDTAAGFVGGFQNNIGSPAGKFGSVVLTGNTNKATQGYAVVVTGGGNHVNGGHGAILTGGGNSISNQGPLGAIVGGQANAVLDGGLGSSILGGWGNRASGDSSCIGGGHSNEVTAHVATVGGGRFNVASAHSATVSGGQNNTASAQGASVGGGGGNEASAENATVSGGQDRTAADIADWAGGGLLQDN